MTDNLEFWNQIDSPPKEALKPITGGRLSGMTSIDPQWRIKKMTEVFGPCGIGWVPEITKEWIEKVDDEVCIFVDINLYVKIGSEWSRPIPASGGSKLATMEKKGVHVSDEAVKMAYTDALSVAMKLLGMGSKIYENKWDGSKYNESETDKDSQHPSFDQIEIIKCEMASLDVDEAKFFEYIGCKSVNDMTMANFDKAVKALASKRKAKESE